MEISPDSIVYEIGPIAINATILFTWLVMALLVVLSWLVTRNLTTSTEISRAQNVLEAIVQAVRNQIEEIDPENSDRYLPFVGTLFIFIATANLLAIVPGYQPPTASLSTTAALAICVFFAVPIFGATRLGVADYLKQYVKPTPIMLPFNIIGEFSRTLALAVRLFGNIMSGTMVVGVLLAIAPFFFPVLLQVLGLITGMIQAYIFAILAMVYIASAARAHDEVQDNSDENG